MWIRLVSFSIVVSYSVHTIFADGDYACVQIGILVPRLPCAKGGGFSTEGRKVGGIVMRLNQARRLCLPCVKGGDFSTEGRKVGGIVLYLHKYFQSVLPIPQSAALTAPFTQGSLLWSPLMPPLCKGRKVGGIVPILVLGPFRFPSQRDHPCVHVPALDLEYREGLFRAAPWARGRAGIEYQHFAECGKLAAVGMPEERGGAAQLLGAIA